MTQGQYVAAYEVSLEVAWIIASFNVSAYPVKSGTYIASPLAIVFVIISVTCDVWSLLVNPGVNNTLYLYASLLASKEID